jgi:hypothetical protein
MTVAWRGADPPARHWIATLVACTFALTAAHLGEGFAGRRGRLHRGHEYLAVHRVRINGDYN